MLNIKHIDNSKDLLVRNWVKENVVDFTGVLELYAIVRGDFPEYDRYSYRGYTANGSFHIVYEVENNDIRFEVMGVIVRLNVGGKK